MFRKHLWKDETLYNKYFEYKNFLIDVKFDK